MKPTSITIPGLSGLGSNGNEEVLPKDPEVESHY